MGVKQRLADSLIFWLALWLALLGTASWVLHHYGFLAGLIAYIAMFTITETLQRLLLGEWSSKMKWWRRQLTRVVRRRA